MPSLRSLPAPLLSIALSLAWGLLSLPGSAATEPVTVGLVTDGPVQQLGEIEQVFVDELLALTEGEFDLRFERHEGDWTLAGIRRALDGAQRSPSVDIVLVVGVSANQIGVSDASFAKPTFLPFVFDAQLMGAPKSGKSSGRANLNYLTDRVDFSEDLQAFGQLAPLRHLGLLVDEVVIDSVPTITAEARRLSLEEGVTVHIIGHDGRDHDLVSKLPPEVDSVMVAGLPRMPRKDYLAVIEDLTTRRLPTYSLIGDEAVKDGLLVSDAPRADWNRLARRNALNVQAVLLGEKAEDQPVGFEGKRVLTINMETARRIGVSPRFDVLEQAVLLHEEPVDITLEHDFIEVARMAEAANLDLAAARLVVAAGEQDIAEARANLRPQLDLGLSRSQRRVGAAVRAGQLAEESLDGRLDLSQVVWSESARGNLTIQKHLQLSREQELEQARLDTIQAATTAFFNVLRAQTQLSVQQDDLKVTRANLDLARDRVRIGSSSPADVYRWESQMAQSRRSLLQARATLEQAREALNRLLHRPLTERYRVTPATVDDPWVISEAEFVKLVDNPRSFEIFVDHLVERGLDNSPEMAQLGAQVAAAEREETLRRRAFWSPDIAVSGSYLDNFDQGGAGAGLLEGENDWSVSVGLQLPLFSGGARRAALRRTNFQLEQLRLLERATKERIEQAIRAAVHSANASYSGIELSAMAAESARKNLDLITDSYAKGVVSVIDLLDAQNASLEADQAEADALADFLIDVMQLQRAVGEFDFLLDPAERQAVADTLREHVTASRGR